MPTPAAVISFGLAEVSSVVVDEEPARGRLQHAGQHGRELALAVALDPGDADDLAAAERQGEIVEPRHALRIADGEAVDLENVGFLGCRGADRRDWRGSSGRRGGAAVGVAIDHGAHQGIDLGGRIGRGRDHAAAAQHGDAIGGLLDLGELVGHQHDAAAAFGDAAAHVEQRGDLVRQQHGGRLVEHEQPRLAHQAFDDLDALALADREVFDLGERLEREAVLLGDVVEPARAGAAIEHALGLAEQDVVDHGQIAHQAEMLVHHRDAARERIGGRRRPVGRSVELHGAGVGSVHTEDQVAQRRLAGAIFAQDAVDLARFDGERDIRQGKQLPEALRHAGKRKQRNRWRVHVALPLARRADGMFDRRRRRVAPPPRSRGR